MLSHDPLKIVLSLACSSALLGGCSSSESSTLRKTGGTANAMGGEAAAEESGGTTTSPGTSGGSPAAGGAPTGGVAPGGTGTCAAMAPSCLVANDTGANTGCTAYGAGCVCDRSSSTVDPRVCTCGDDLTWSCVHQNQGGGGATGTGGVATGGVATGGTSTCSPTAPSCQGVNDTGPNTGCTAYGAGCVCDRSSSAADPRVCTCTESGAGTLAWVCTRRNG
jgi:hypothetical protein